MPKFGIARSRWTLAAWPTGETSPGPCQAERTRNKEISTVPLATNRDGSPRLGTAARVVPHAAPAPGRNSAAALPLLRPDHGAVAAADVAPAHVEAGVVAYRELGRELLVEVDAQAGPVVGVVVAVAQHRAAGENVLLGLVELAGLLDAEIRDRQVQVDVGRVAHRRDVARAV